MHCTRLYVSYYHHNSSGTKFVDRSTFKSRRSKVTWSVYALVVLDSRTKLKVIRSTQVHSALIELNRLVERDYAWPTAHTTHRSDEFWKSNGHMSRSQCQRTGHSVEIAWTDYAVRSNSFMRYCLKPGTARYGQLTTNELLVFKLPRKPYDMSATAAAPSCYLCGPELGVYFLGTDWYVTVLYMRVAGTWPNNSRLIGLWAYTICICMYAGWSKKV